MKTRIALNRLCGLVLLVSAISGGLVRSQTHIPPVSAPANLPSEAVASPSVFSPTNQTAVSSPGSALAAAIRDETGRNVPLPVPKVSKPLADFVRVIRTGIGESGLLSFINSAAGTFDLGADQIIYLQKLGIPSGMIIAMLQHDADVFSGKRAPGPSPLVVSQSPAPPAAAIYQDLSNKESQSAKSGSPSSSMAPSQPSSNPPGTNDLTAPHVLAENPAVPSRAEMDATLSDVLEAVPLADLSEVEDWVEEEPELYPVRKPYPVKLSDPIIVLRAPTLAPNLVVIQPLP